MPLSEEAKSRAKEKAKAYLEYSIYTLAILLALDPEDLPDQYDNPVVLLDDLSNQQLWSSHESLKMQIAAYSKLA